MKSVYKAGAANRESRIYRGEGLTDSGLASVLSCDYLLKSRDKQNSCFIRIGGKRNE